MLVIFHPFQRLYRRLDLTRGEQSLVLAYFGVGFFGAAMAMNVVMTLGGVAALMTPFSGYDYWVIFSGAVGAGCGLYLGRNWMGHTGFRGVAFAMIGMLWVSFLGGLVGGSLALPVYGTMFGPFTLFVSLFSAPFLAVVWGCVLFASHLLLKIWRQERDSIFHAVPLEGHFDGF
tara:strand:- start:88 stop:609 length:522 start_codon:yes stop_codon:yes gene_type:complete